MNRGYRYSTVIRTGIRTCVPCGGAARNHRTIGSPHLLMHCETTFVKIFRYACNWTESILPDSGENYRIMYVYKIG